MTDAEKVDGVAGEDQESEELVPELLELETATVQWNQLYLDPHNPRSASLTGEDETPISDEQIPEESLQKELSDELRRSPGIDDIVEKIKKYGFLKIDRIVVRPLSGIDDSFIVLEGNRRIAAVRYLQTNRRLFVTLPKHVQASLSEIEVLVYRGSKSGISWDVQGLRHIDSIKEWGPYQRGRFLVRLQDDKGLTPTELAKIVPVGPQTINKLIRSYRGFRQFSKNVEFGDQLAESDFSVLQEAIFHRMESPLWKWLEWNDDEKRFKNEANLTTLLKLLKEKDDTGSVRISRVNPDLRDKFSSLLVPEHNMELQSFLNGDLDIDQAYAKIKREEEDKRTATDVLDLDAQERRLKEIEASLQTLPLPSIREQGAVDRFSEALDRISLAASEEAKLLRS